MSEIPESWYGHEPSGIVMTGREQARERLQQHRLIWAYGTINDWGNRIDPGPAGDWARRVRGLWLWQLGHQIETSSETSQDRGLTSRT